MAPYPTTIERFDATTLHSLAGRLLGKIVRPGDPDYDTARQTYDPQVDRYPEAIVQVRDAADIIRAVAFAREHDLPLAVRSGGHSVASHSVVDGGLVIDLAPMNAVSVDPERRTAWVQAGATSADLAPAAQAHGLALSTGDAGDVGLGGLTLGGGIGWFARKYGLTIDSLRSVELVTADGRLLVASETEHPDLFWALRGGGGNFGVATAFEFQLQPVGTVLGGPLILPATAQILRRVVDYGVQAPDELTMQVMLMPAPPAPFIPAEHQGKLVLFVLLCYTGDLTEGQTVVDGLRAIASPIADLVRPMPYPAMFEMGPPEGQRPSMSVRSAFFDELSDATLETILAFLQRPSPAIKMAQIRPLGGAMSRVPTDATAFAHRDAAFMVTVVSTWMDPTEGAEQRAWTEELWAIVRPEASGAYVNFLGDEGPARVREAYPAETYARLAAVKRQYDPTNVFHSNHNVPPAA